MSLISNKDLLKMFPTAASLADELKETTNTLHVARENIATTGLIRKSKKELKKIAASTPISENFWLQPFSKKLPTVSPSVEDIPSATIAKDRLVRRFAKDTLESI